MLASDLSPGRRAGARLRELRTERSLSLGAVAARAGLSESALSRLESGERRLTVDHLSAIAGALDVSAAEVLAPTPVGGGPVRHDGLTIWPLTTRGPAAGLRAFKARISPERRYPPLELGEHDGRHFIYVLSGTLRLLLAGDDLRVPPGEVVEFSTRTPHWFGAVDGAVELVVIRSAGEAEVVRRSAEA